MFKLYVSTFEDEGMLKWGLFYEDARGIQQLTEDFKPISYDTEEAAKHKLEVMEAEH